MPPVLPAMLEPPAVHYDTSPRRRTRFFQTLERAPRAAGELRATRSAGTGHGERAAGLAAAAWSRTITLSFDA